jgi:predicted ArsR family transcriptional regulator
MEGGMLGKRFWETTRGQVVALLRRSGQTVEELAKALGVTDNAVRSHLASLERDGLVRQDGVRRVAGAGKPAVLYELHPQAAPLLSRAYAPVLEALVQVLLEELPADQSDAVLRKVGRRLAASVGGKSGGDLGARVGAAAKVIEALGGDVQVETSASGHSIRGSGCPLSTVVGHRPEFCTAIETLVGEIVGGRVRSCCEHGPRPRCCFAIDGADYAA